MGMADHSSSNESEEAGFYATLKKEQKADLKAKGSQRDAIS